MQSPSELIETLPDDRKNVMIHLRELCKKHLPTGFQESVNYGMISYCVPLSIYPAGYHCNPKSPLPFLSIASQKNFIAIYHMGLYSNEALLNWFKSEFPNHAKAKLDMGKSCVRFKKMDDIPFNLLATLFEKISVQEWIECYEKALKR
jgi:hypothetical protein